MTTAFPNPVADFRHHPPEFSLVLGGPLYQLMRRAHISDDALGLARRRIASVTILCWLPLFVLSAWQGNLWGTAIAVPFLMDVEVHARFLVAVPLLVAAELVVHQRMRSVVAQFLERDLIAEKDMERFQAAITSATTLRNSAIAEIVILLLVYCGVLVISPQRFPLETDTWLSMPSGDSWNRSLAGIWLIYVSLPVFHLLLLRWYFRIFVWARFLWQIARLPLCLVAIHPDRAGGLGFLSNTVYAYLPLLVAHGALLAGFFASRIFHLGESLMDFKLEVAVFTVFLLCLVQVPLLVFTPQLAQAKRTGQREYGALASRYVHAFDEKWLHRGGPPNEPFLGSADVQSLADLDGSYEIIRSMRTTLVSRQAILTFAGAIVAPIVPLTLTIMPWEELLKKLLGILF